MITHLVQLPDDAVEVHVAVAQGDKVPAPPGVPKFDMAAQDACPAVQGHLHVLHVHVIDPVRKIPQEHAGIHPLPHQVGGVEVEAQGGTAVKDLQQLGRAIVVEGDLRGMYLQGKLHIAFVKHVEDGGPQFLDPGKAGIHHFLRGLGEGIPIGPDGGAQEAGHHMDAQLLGRPGHGLHLLDGPGPNLLGLARQGVGGEVIQPGVPIVPHALADQMGA